MPRAKIKFIGVGSAFAAAEMGNSNMVVESDTGKKLLIDCGFRVQDMLRNAYGIGNAQVGEIDGVYISHLHADHIGGMEWLALCTFFNPNCPPPKLYCVGGLMQELWDKSLRGGLETLQVREKIGTSVEARLTTYFDVQPININESFTWEGIIFRPVQTTHVMSGFRIQFCYGLMIEPMLMPRAPVIKRRIFLTGDTQFVPNLDSLYTTANIVLHDCETGFRSGVHPHYDDMKELPEDVKKKIYLYHYNEPKAPDAGAEDGFGGFIQVGDAFEI